MGRNNLFNIPNNKENRNMDLKKKLTLAKWGLGTFLAFVGFFALIGYDKVEGDERLVTQDFLSGVSDEIIGSGNYYYIPLKTTTYKYNIGAEKFIMGDPQFYNEEKVGEEVDYPAFSITCGGVGKEQPATFSVTLNYELNPDKLVALHNKARDDYEDKLIKPALVKILTEAATPQEVLNFWSGEGRVALHETVEEAIKTHPVLSTYGIDVLNIVFDDISLETKYTEEIIGRQTAVASQARKFEETKAEQQEALRVEAKAQADANKRVVAAEAAKQEEIKKAEASNQSRILAAKAQAQEIKEKAAAERYRKEQDAKGLLAQGIAEAKVADAKKVSKYSGVSGQRAAAVEIEQARVGLFKNMALKGIVPQDTVMTIINGGSNPVLTVPAVNKKK